MKYYSYVLATFLLFSFTNVEHKKTDFESIALVELFTSQGCSSCPSADKVLSKLVEKAESSGKPLYGLSFHVSYWNRLGWKDPFSKEVYTDRQRKYGATLNTSSIYTPQMIVNGKYQFVGSSQTKADQAIKRAMGQAAKTEVAINNVTLSDEVVSIDYTLNGTFKDTFLNIAIVERDLKNHVPRGENQGLTLHHDNVVRSFKTVYSQQTGAVTIDLPANLVDPAKTSIIVYVQNKRNLEVYGASRTSLRK